MNTKFGQVTIQVVNTSLYMGNKRIFITVAQYVTDFYVGEILLDVKAEDARPVVAEIKDYTVVSCTFREFVECVTDMVEDMRGIIQIRYNFDLQGVTQ